MFTKHKGEFTKKQIGSLGEELACDYLRKKKYKILEKNYRHKRGEIDIIGKNKNFIIFFEVKFRSSVKHGYPEEFVTKKKIKLFQSTAEHYIKKTNWYGPIRFDIIAITEKEILEPISTHYQMKKSPLECLSPNSINILHFKDAF